MGIILSIDLSGPRSSDETGVAWFEMANGKLELAGSQIGATDSELAGLAEDLGASQELFVGIDAPLSYGTRSGSRRADQDLREKLIQLGGHPGTVMAPTAPRMVYLTLRGMAVARAMTLLESRERIRIVEVHPGAALLLRGARTDDARGFKRDSRARVRLLEWLGAQGLNGLDPLLASSDHLVAACAGALATWDWSQSRSPWIAPADPPTHPFDFAG
jgi:uncharacterized protein